MTSPHLGRRSIVVGACALFVSACSSKSSSSSASSQALNRFRSAQSKLAKTSTYHVKMTSSGAPSQESSLSGGEGDYVVKTSAFSGTASVNASGNQLNIGVVSIGSSTWIRPNNKGTYVHFDPTTVGVPAPSGLFGAKSGVPSIPGLSTDLKAAGQRTVDGQKLDMYRGSVDPVKVTKALGFGQARSDYTVDVGINADDDMCLIVLQGPFFASANATYTVALSRFGEKVTITAPAAK